MTAPAAVANAVADALGLDDGDVDLELPLTPARVWALIEATRR
jgi:CO/xanthine dehydrogenase Mo-binding subunit